LRLVPAAGDPSAPQDGDLWYNTTTGKFRKREGGATSDLDSTGGGEFVPFASRAYARRITTGVSVPHATLTEIAWNDESYDTAAFWDSGAGGRFTIPSGVATVLLWGYLQFTSALGTNNHIQVRHFDSANNEVSGPYTFPLDGGTYGSLASGPIGVSAGDHLTLSAYQNSGSSKTTYSDGRCYFAIAAVA
jgi:hypothetical protein